MPDARTKIVGPRFSLKWLLVLVLIFGWLLAMARQVWIYALDAGTPTNPMTVAQAVERIGAGLPIGSTRERSSSGSDGKVWGV